MARNRCPHCDRRLPYAGRRCVHCSWSVREEGLAPGEGIAWWRRRGLWAVIMGALLLTGAGLGYRNAPQLADWYANFAAENLPASASSFAPTESEAGAFFYCARQVARRMNGQFSVETFPSQQESELRSLGAGRYRVESFVDETREDGSRVRYVFVCSVTYDRGRWVLEQLDLNERFATTPGQGPALATRD
jgi:hypothetical protein